MKKKLLVALLSFIMVVTMMPLHVFADTANPKNAPAKVFFKVQPEGAGYFYNRDDHVPFDLIWNAYEMCLQDWNLLAVITDEADWYNIVPHEEPGYKFVGWDPTPPTTDTRVDWDYTFTGIFKSEKHTVTFDPMNGSDPWNVEVNDGDPVAEPEQPIREGYTFDGWYTDSEYQNQFNFDTPINDDTTLYAKWTAIPYTIDKSMTEGVSSIFAQVEGTEAEQATIGTTVSVSALPDTTYQINSITITPTDKTIDPIVITGDQGQFTMPASDVTITATAEHVAQHEVAFDMQGHGQQIASQEVYDGQTVTKPEDPQEAGYTFDGWYKEAACKNEFDFDTPIKDDTTLYAKWTAIPYAINKTTSEGVSSISAQVEGTEAEQATIGTTVSVSAFPDTTYQINSITVTPTDKKIDPIVITGDQGQFTMPASDVTITATAERLAQYEVAFDMQGHGQQIASQEVYDGQTVTKPEDPQEVGYTFDGWYKEAACKNEFDFDTPIKDDTTLYAKWTAIPYTIDKSITEGVSSISAKVEGTEAEKATIGSTVSVSALPKMTYQINSITITPTDKTIDPIVITGDQGQFTMPASDVTITATAEHVAQHEVAFDMQGHGQQIKSQEVYDGQRATEPVDPQEPGYTFDGWYKEKECENKFYFETQIKADTTLYAKWTAIPYAINKTTSEGVSSISTQVEGTETEQATIGTTVSVSAFPDTTYQIQNITITPSDTKIDPIVITGDQGQFTMPASDVTITATAEHVAQHEVAFDMQGHGQQIASQEVYDGLTVDRPTDPKEVGYTFDGWFKEAACENEFDFDTPINADTTLYAKWTSIPYAINKTTSEGVSSISTQVEGTEAEHATIGTTVSVSALPDTTYQIQNITITPSDTTIDPIVITGDQGQFTMPASDVTITASAEHVAQHEVTFDMQGHGQQIASQAVYDGQTVTKPEEPRERGYIFDGWFKEAGCENEFDFDTPITGDTVLYAKWTAVKVPQVTGLDAKVIDSKTASVTWNKVTGFDEVKYEVWRKAGDSGTFKKIATTTSNSYKDTKVITGTKYYYEVRAICTASGETYTGKFSNTDYAYPCLYQVTKLSAIALNAANIQLKWNANGNKNVVYQIYRSTKSDSGFAKVGTITDGKTNFSQSFTPEQSGKKYYYKVRAITKDYTGKWHYGTFSKVDYAYPRVATPTGFKAWASGKHTCNCSWNKVAGSNVKYLVYRGTKPTGNWGKAIATTTKTNFTNKNMKSGKKYYYMVRAVQTINGKKYYSDYSAKDYAYPR